MLDGTYTGLKASVADFLNRSDLTAAIPDFITLAEAQISRRLLKDGPVRGMMGRSDASITSEFVAVPTDFMGVKAIYLTDTGTTDPLVYAEPNQLNTLKQQFPSGYPSGYAYAGPTTFSVVGGELQFWPWNAGTYPAEMTYWKRIPALSSTNPTNWVMQMHPDAYLYGALLQSPGYLKDDGRRDIWGSAFETILADMVMADKIERTGPTLAIPYVIGPTP